MVLARWQATIQDEDGNALPSASVEVRQDITGSPLAVLYSDRAGTVSIGNPFNADADGFAAFHVTGGAYKITVTSGAFSRVYRYVGIGLNSERDFIEVFNPRGEWDPATTYAEGDLVSFGGFAFVSNDDGNVGHSPPGLGSPISSPLSDTFWTHVGTVGTSGADGAPGSSDVTGTSTTSIAIGAATPTFTIVEDDRGWAIGARLRASSLAAPASNWMEGVVTAYSLNSLTLAIDLTFGSGTHSDWSFNLAGQEGEQGVQGDTGVTPAFSIGTVVSIPPGSPSTSVSITGTAEAPVLNFEIERGETGLPGADGLTPNFTIGTVVSIPAGSPSASVSITGSAPNFVLNFELERGVDGTNGTNGADGVDPGYLYNFETGTAAPPSSGAIRFNNATLSAATQAFISETTRGGSGIAARLAELFDANHSILSTIILTDPATEAQASFQVTSYTDSGTYATLGLQAHAGATSFSAGAISLQRELAGNDGADGSGSMNGPAFGSPAIAIGELPIFSDPDGQHLDGSGRQFASDAEVQAATVNRVLEASHLRTAAAYEALADTPTLAIDWTAAINWEVTIGGARVIGNPTNGIPGQFRNILMKGSSSASPTEEHAVTFGDQFQGDLPTISNVDVNRWYLVTLICITDQHFSASAKRVFGSA